MGTSPDACETILNLSPEQCRQEHRCTDCGEVQPLSAFLSWDDPTIISFPKQCYGCGFQASIKAAYVENVKRDERFGLIAEIARLEHSKAEAFNRGQRSLHRDCQRKPSEFPVNKIEEWVTVCIEGFEREENLSERSTSAEDPNHQETNTMVETLQALLPRDYESSSLDERMEVDTERTALGSEIGNYDVANFVGDEEFASENEHNEVEDQPAPISGEGTASDNEQGSDTAQSDAPVSSLAEKQHTFTCDDCEKLLPLFYRRALSNKDQVDSDLCASCRIGFSVKRQLKDMKKQKFLSEEAELAAWDRLEGLPIKKAEDFIKAVENDTDPTWYPRPANEDCYVNIRQAAERLQAQIIEDPAYVTAKARCAEQPEESATTVMGQPAVADTTGEGAVSMRPHTRAIARATTTTVTGSVQRVATNQTRIQSTHGDTPLAESSHKGNRKRTHTDSNANTVTGREGTSGQNRKSKRPRQGAGLSNGGLQPNISTRNNDPQHASREIVSNAEHTTDEDRLSPSAQENFNEAFSCWKTLGELFDEVRKRGTPGARHSFLEVGGDFGYRLGRMRGLYEAFLSDVKEKRWYQPNSTLNQGL